MQPAFRPGYSTPALDINEHLPSLKRYAAQCGVIAEFGVRNVVSYRLQWMAHGGL